MSMLAFAAALGKEVERKFRTLNYCEREFADLATATLLDHDAGMTFTPEDVLEAGLNHELPWQADVDSVFGEPAITLYAHPRFRLDALCWRNGTTSIHQHQFTGAFAVAWGGSLQSTFAFAPRLSITDHFKIGDLIHIESKILSRGHVEAIHPGDQLIHSVFHLESPSISLVLRTHRATATGVQFRYEPPHLAHDPSDGDTHSTKCLQIVDYLCDVRPAGYERRLAAIVADATIPLAFHILRRVKMGGLDNGVWQMILDAAFTQHGDVIAQLIPVLNNTDIQRRLIRLRKTVRRDDLRFLLALILNVPTPQKIMSLVSERVGKDRCIATVITWLLEIESMIEGNQGIIQQEKHCLEHLLSAGALPESISSDHSFMRSVVRLRKYYLTASFVPPQSESDGMKQRDTAGIGRLIAS